MSLNLDSSNNQGCTEALEAITRSSPGIYQEATRDQSQFPLVSRQKKQSALSSPSEPMDSPKHSVGIHDASWCIHQGYKHSRR